MTQGRVVLVGGHSRGVGKTALVAWLLRCRRWSKVAAVKVSAHRHSAVGDGAIIWEDRNGASLGTSTARYLDAGANRAFLCRCPTSHLGEAAQFVRDLTTEGSDVIVESNRLAPLLAADVALFVVSARVDDWKATSGPSLRGADALVRSPGTTALPAPARALLGNGRPREFAFSYDWTVAELGRWVDAAFESSRVASVGLPHSMVGLQATVEIGRV